MNTPEPIPTPTTPITPTTPASPTMDPREAHPRRVLWNGASAALLTLLVVNAVWAAEPTWAQQGRATERIDHRSIGRALATAVRDLVGQQYDAMAPTGFGVVTHHRPVAGLFSGVGGAPVLSPPREALIDLPPPIC